MNDRTRHTKPPSPQNIARGGKLRAKRVELGLKHQHIADHLGITSSAVSQWEAGLTSPKPDQLPKLSEILRMSIAEILTPLTGLPEVSPADDNLTAIVGAPATVPVYETERVGVEGAFFVSSNITEYVKRPPGIAALKEVYAINMTTDCMAPWAREGDLLYVTPSRPPSVNLAVVVQLRDATTGDLVTVVREYLGRSGGNLKLLQHNPRKEASIPLKDVVSVHRVLTLRELMGA
jgi:transcriptional regulator with XRE-family HTH domain